MVSISTTFLVNSTSETYVRSPCLSDDVAAKAIAVINVPPFRPLPPGMVPKNTIFFNGSPPRNVPRSLPLPLCLVGTKNILLFFLICPPDVLCRQMFFFLQVFYPSPRPDQVVSRPQCCPITLSGAAPVFPSFLLSPIPCFLMFQKTRFMFIGSSPPPVSSRQWSP